MSTNGTINTLKIRNFAPALFVLLVFVVVCFPVINGLIGSWIASEDNSHGFLIFPVFLYMLWQKRAQLADTRIVGSNLGGFFLFLSLLVFVLAKAGGILSLTSLSCWFGVDQKHGFPIGVFIVHVPHPKPDLCCSNGASAAFCLTGFLRLAESITCADHLPGKRDRTPGADLSGRTGL